MSSISNIKIKGLEYEFEDTSARKYAFSGDYNDLKNQPVIPSKTSELENDLSYVTTSSISNDIERINNVEEITNRIYGNISASSIWELGVIGGGVGGLVSSTTRLRTTGFRTPCVKIEIDKEFEYGLCFYDKSLNWIGYADMKGSYDSLEAHYTTDSLAVEALMYSVNASYYKVIMRHSDDNTKTMSTDDALHIRIYDIKKDSCISYSDIAGVGSITNVSDPNSQLWSKWNSRLAFGMDTSSARVPFAVNGQFFADGTIIAHNAGSGSNRWGYHLYEGYAKDNYSRMTMLVNKHDNECNDKPSLEFYYYTGGDHYAPSYGNTKIGSDVLYHSFLFDRDTFTAYGKVDLRYPITLARINPSNALDNTYSTVTEADAAHEPESDAVAHVKCLKYLSLKNADNGAMFYDSEKNKVVIKINGKWCYLNVTQAPDDAYDF